MNFLINLIIQLQCSIINLESGSRMPKKSDKIYEKSRGTSLFSDISPYRNCKDAGIDSYWCSCLKRTKIEVDSDLINIAEYFVSYLNKDILGGHLDLCHELELDTVNSVYLTSSYLKSDKQHKVGWDDNKHIKKLNLLQPPKVEKDYKKYLFVITTKPNRGEYEFTITVQNSVNGKKKNENNIEIDQGLISRINKYGNDEHCIHDQFPDLRKYCYCRN